MPITISINSGTDFEPVSEGVHAAVIADVVDKGIQQTAFGPKHKIMFLYVTDENDENNRPKYVFQSFTASLHEKASLRKAVKSLRGKDIEDSSFDVETLIGTQTSLVIQHSESNGKVYANVASILKPNPKMHVVIPSDFVRKQDKPAKEGFTAKPKSGQDNSARTTGGGMQAARAILAPASQPIGDDDIPF